MTLKQQKTRVIDISQEKSVECANDNIEVTDRLVANQTEVEDKFEITNKGTDPVPTRELTPKPVQKAKQILKKAIGLRPRGGSFWCVQSECSERAKQMRAFSPPASPSAFTTSRFFTRRQQQSYL